VTEDGSIGNDGYGVGNKLAAVTSGYGLLAKPHLIAVSILSMECMYLSRGLFAVES